MVFHAAEPTKRKAEHYDICSETSAAEQVDKLFDDNGEELLTEEPDQPAAAASSDWDKAAFTAGILEVVTQGSTVSAGVAQARAQDAAQGVANESMPAQLAQGSRGFGAAVNLDRIIGELVQAHQRIQVLEISVAQQQKVLSKTERVKDQSQTFATDLRDAQDQCQDTLINFLAGRRRVDPSDL